MQATANLKTFGRAGDANSIKTIMQQTFQLTCELYKKIEVQRKECSIPGSSAAEGDGTQLFGRDDLNNAALKVKVDQASRFQPFRKGPKGPSYQFRGYNGATGI